MPKRSALQAARALVALAIALAAPTATAAAKMPKVMVLDLGHDESLKPSVMAALNGFLVGAVRDQGFPVVTPSQIGAVLGVERQRQLLGCSESSCLAEIGGAMGVDFIVQGNVSLLTKNSAVTLTLVDSKGTAVSTQQEVVAGQDVDAFIPVIQRLVPKLMAVARPGYQPDLASKPSTAAEPAAGGLQTSEAAASAGHPTGSYVLMGTGVALLAASVVTGLMARSSQSAYQNDVRSGQDHTADASATNRNALISTVALGLGVAAVGTGGAWWLTSGSGAEVAR